MKKIVPIIGAVASLLILTGCNTVAGAGQDLHNAGQTLTSSVAKKPTDAQITKTILYRLKNNKEITEPFIQVKTYKGVVTLSGTVKNYHQRKVAVNTAASVKGVSIVKDRLIVRK